MDGIDGFDASAQVFAQVFASRAPSSPAGRHPARVPQVPMTSWR
jgi:hypothetical protein